MKKLSFTLMLIGLLGITISARCQDTIPVKTGNVSFVVKNYVSGNDTITRYIALYNGVTYQTTKSDMKRYELQKKYSFTPCVLIINNRKNKFIRVL